MDQTDIKPIVDVLAQAELGVLVGFATWAVQRLGSHFSAQANATQQANYNTALKHSLSAAYAACSGAIARWGSDHPEAQRALLAYAGDALLKNFPATAKAVGVKTPADAQDALARIMSTLPKVPPQGQGEVK